MPDCDTNLCCWRRTLRVLVVQAGFIVFFSCVVALVWNRWVSDKRLPLIRRAVPTPFATPVASNGFVSLDEIPETVTYQIVDVTQAYQMFMDNSATFIDARLKEEHDEGHIPGSVCLPSEQFDIYYPEVQHLLPFDRPLIVYCIGSDCDLSSEICLFLMSMGYKNLFLYEGGWPEWVESGLPQSSASEMTASPEGVHDATD